VSLPGWPPGDLVAASTGEIMDAIGRAGRGNALLGISTGRDDGLASACRGPVDEAAAARLVDAVGGWLRTDERRVAASMVVLGYAARLVGPAIAAFVQSGILLDVRPAQVRFSFAPGRGFRLTLPEPGGWRAEPAELCRHWGRLVVDGHLQPLIDTVRTVVPVAAGLLWGNVASSVAGALRAIAQDATIAADRRQAGTDLLGYGPLRGAGRFDDYGSVPTFVRRSCCLYYRLDGGGMCGDCPLPKREPM
jgi:ferric iron reductase protein FhuF